MTRSSSVESSTRIEWTVMGHSLKSLKDAHKHSVFNEEEIKDSYLCVCFYCCTYFAIEKVAEWTDSESDKGATALCPVCGIDAVLGNRCRFPIEDPSFVRAMHKHWFPPAKKPQADKRKNTKKK